MEELIRVLSNLITNNIFISYGLYTLLFILISLFIKYNDRVKKMDAGINRILAVSGLLYFVCVLIWLILSATHMNDQTRAVQYSWVPWVQVACWMVVTQLMWIKRLRENRVVRLIAALFLIFSFERFIILVTFLHRDYLPAAWQ